MWRVSNSASALKEALARQDRRCFDSDRGTQFTSTAFTAVVLREKIANGRDDMRCGGLLVDSAMLAFV